MDDLVRRALDFGFSHAGPLRANTLVLRPEVRDMCSADKCKKYGKSWMCPPACGGIDENQAVLDTFTSGLIVQTTGELEDDFDYEVMEQAGKDQKQRFQAFWQQIRGEYPGMMALTSGACDLCEQCTYPDAPCVHPDDAVPSMEAFGLVVSDTCRDNGIPYYYGPRTITYTGCYLFRQPQEV